MTGIIFLGGGGDENKAYAVDTIFLKNIKKILYIPLAWKDGNYESCKKWFTKMISQHRKIKIDMTINLKEDINLSKYDAVYIGGGNTFKLLKSIKDSGFDKKLIKYYKSGGKIFGGSAGAIILGNKIDIALHCSDRDENLVRIKNTKGMNLAKNYDIQCHFEENQYDEHTKYVSKEKRNVIAIPEDSAVIISGKSYKVIGGSPITIFTKKKVFKVNPGKKITL